MFARVIIAGHAGNVAQLTYAIPPALEGRVECGHRVLVPVRSRRMTGLVVEVGPDLDAGGATPKAILELLEPRPLFDRAHLQLIEFMASYYMVPIGEAYRSVIPAVARVESRRMFKLGSAPGVLAHATFTPLERTILEAIAARPLTARQIKALGDPAEADTALVRLCADGFVEPYDSTRGRHRVTTPSFARLCADLAPAKLRGRLQRAIQAQLAAANHHGVAIATLEADLPGARAALRTMVQRGVAEIVTDNASACANNATPDDGSAFAVNADGASIADPIAAAPNFDLSWEQAAAVAEATPAIRDRRDRNLSVLGHHRERQDRGLRPACGGRARGRPPGDRAGAGNRAGGSSRAAPFAARFGSLVASLHSAQNVAERWAELDGGAGRRIADHDRTALRDLRAAP